LEIEVQLTGFRRLLVAMVLALVVTVVPAASVHSAECFFDSGFKTLHDLIPDIVGSCTTNEMHNPENGDGLQLTTGGLLVWRKVDNWTAFTNGVTTWINGPFGLQSRPNGERFPWEAAAAPAPSSPAPTPSTAVPTLTTVADAAKRTGVDPSAIQVVSVEARDWPDSSLGCPKPGFAYSQIVTPGFRIVLNAAGKQLEYHTDRGQQLVSC
jgi:hypothetical protein